MAEILNTTPTPVYDPILMIAIVIFILGAVTLFTILPALRASSINAVQAINVGYTRHDQKPSRLAAFARKLKMSPVVIYGVKDIFAHPYRTASTIIGLIFTITIVVFAIGADATISELSQNPMYFQGTPADMQINRNFVSDAETRDLLNQHAEIERFYSFDPAFGWEKDNVESPIYIRLLSDDYAAFDFRIVEGRMIQNPGEAVVGYKILSNYEREIGDDLELIIEGKPITLKIVGYYTEQFNTGNTVMFDMADYHQFIDPDEEITIYNPDLVPVTDRQALKHNLLQASDDQFDIVITSTDASPTALALRTMSRALSFILLLIAVVNLLSSSLLSVQERFRDFGIQKTIGFTPVQIIMSVLAGITTIVLIALAMGIPISLVIFRIWMRGTGIAIGAGPRFGEMSYPGLMLLLPLMLLVAVLCGTLPARRAVQVQVADALRYE